MFADTLENEELKTEQQLNNFENIEDEESTMPPELQDITVGPQVQQIPHPEDNTAVNFTI